MHDEGHDWGGTPLLLHGGLLDIHQQLGELLPREIRRTTYQPTNHRGGRPKLAHPQVLTMSLLKMRVIFRRADLG